MERIKKFSAKTFSSLKIRNYRLYFISQAISLCGTWTQTIAQDWLVLKLTNSGTQLGLVSAMQFLPILIFGAWGGVVADRFNKRAILYVTQSILGILALTLGLLVAAGLIQLWMVYVLALALGFTNAINNPTRQTFISEMVGKDDLPNAVSLNSTQFNLARVIGPAIAGALIAVLGLSWCFIINAISYIASLAGFFMMRGSELHISPLVEKAKGQLKEGLRYVVSQPNLKITLIIMVIVGTLSYEFSVALPLLAKFTFNGDAATYAELSASMGIGAVMGGLYSASRHKMSVRLIIIGAFLFGASLLIVSAAPNLLSAMISLVLVGALSVNMSSMASSTLQLESAPEMRGRVMALWTVAILGSTPIGGPIIGYVGQYAGPRWGLVLGGVAAVFAAGIGTLYTRKQKPA